MKKSKMTKITLLLVLTAGIIGTFISCDNPLFPGTDDEQKAFVLAPTFSPEAGTYDSDQSIEISSDTEGATIYYTIDGSDPDDNSSEYTGPITITEGTTTIKAIAYKDGMNPSSIVSGEYTVDYNQVVTPSFSPSEGTYSSDQTVEITSSTSEATIYYTTDGSTPDTSSNEYTGAISISGDGTSKTIKAIAVKDGMNNSAVAEASYTISYDAVSAPQFNPSDGTYSSDQTVEISTLTTDATIYYTYTTDGSTPATPTTSSNKYSDAISVSGDGNSKTIKAIAVKEGFKDSNVVEATYTIDYPNLTVNTNGNGVVELTPSNLTYPAGTDISLRSIPDAQNLFVGWSGSVSSKENPTTFTIETDTIITANFEPQENFPNYLDRTITAGMVFYSSSSYYTRTMRITNNSGSDVEVTKAEIWHSDGYLSGSTTDHTDVGTLSTGETQEITWYFTLNPGPYMVAKWYCDFVGYSFTVEVVAY